MGGDWTAGSLGRDPGCSTGIRRGETRSWDSEKKPRNPRRQLPLHKPGATKTLLLGGTETSPPAGTQTPEPGSSAPHLVHGSVRRGAKPVRNRRLPSLPGSLLQGSAPGQSGSGLQTAAPAIVRRINGLRRDAGAQRSTGRSPCACLPAGLWSLVEVQLPPFELRQTKNPILLFPVELFRVHASPSCCQHPPASTAAVVQTLRPLHVPSTVPALDPSRGEDEHPRPRSRPAPSGSEASR